MLKILTAVKEVRHLHESKPRIYLFYAHTHTHTHPPTHIYICIYKVPFIFSILNGHQAQNQRLSPKIILEITKFSKTFRMPKTITGKHPNMVIAFIPALIGVDYLFYEHTC